MRVIPRLLLVLTIWAALYLPWLGAPEYYSEEGHRVMPAVEMIESGNYLVPTVAGQLYFNKPPLLNWLIAASFKCFGVREWSARFVSVCAVLLGAVVFLFATRREFGRNGALLAALVWLTNFGLIEKGRMAEIEALYTMLFALALIAWLKLWRAQRNPWLTWTIPFVFLGVGLLAKGPANLLFFYCIVIAILRSAGEMKQLRQSAHFAGIVIAVGIFALWAVPYYFAINHEASPSKEWSREMVAPIIGQRHGFSGWIENYPRGIGYFLPWLLLLPFLRLKMIDDARDRAIAGGLAWGSVLPSFALLSLPFSYPRYVIPAVGPLCCVIALASKANAFEWRIPKLGTAIPRWLIPGAIAITCFAAIIVWPSQTARVLAKTPKLKARAAQVNQQVAPNESIYVYRLYFQPYLLYVQARVRYIDSLDQVPRDAHYILVNDYDLPALEQNETWRAFQPRGVLTTERFRNISSVLFRVSR